MALRTGCGGSPTCRVDGSYNFDGAHDLALTDGATHATEHLAVEPLSTSAGAADPSAASNSSGKALQPRDSAHHRGRRNPHRQRRQWTAPADDHRGERRRGLDDLPGRGRSASPFDRTPRRAAVEQAWKRHRPAPGRPARDTGRGAPRHRFIGHLDCVQRHGSARRDRSADDGDDGLRQRSGLDGKGRERLRHPRRSPLSRCHACRCGHGM